MGTGYFAVVFDAEKECTAATIREAHHDLDEFAISVRLAAVPLAFELDEEIFAFRDEVSQLLFRKHWRGLMRRAS